MNLSDAMQHWCCLGGVPSSIMRPPCFYGLDFNFIIFMLLLNDCISLLKLVSRIYDASNCEDFKIGDMKAVVLRARYD